MVGHRRLSLGIRGENLDHDPSGNKRQQQDRAANEFWRKAAETRLTAAVGHRTSDGVPSVNALRDEMANGCIEKQDEAAEGSERHVTGGHPGDHLGYHASDQRQDEKEIEEPDCRFVLADGKRHSFFNHQFISWFGLIRASIDTGLAVRTLAVLGWHTLASVTIARGPLTGNGLATLAEWLDAIEIRTAEEIEALGSISANVAVARSFLQIYPKM
ncbi:hypothetical protein [Sphingomonas sp. 3-13AW]|uniref:hypothetical protein n=1 Tax=Sphingomonas sp. 3-13AW TaxID=3050450 RepID=UPI003BB67832